MTKDAAKAPTCPADKVERRKVASLVPYAKNARTHSPEQVDQLVASIKEWGWTTPILLALRTTTDPYRKAPADG